MRAGLIGIFLLLTTFQMLLITFVKGQNITAEQVTMGLQHESMATGLKKIEQQTSLRFFYRNADIKLLTNLSLPVGTRTVQETLNQLLQNTFISFKQVGDKILLEKNRQTVYAINGRVVATDHKAVSFAIVSIVKAHELIQTAETDARGYFKLTATTKGDYLVKISTMGMDSLSVAITLGEMKTVKLPDITLVASHMQLQDVVITSAKPLITQEIDRIVYDVQVDPDSKSDNMLELMRKVPFISMDGNDNLLLKGSTSFKVLINGLPSGIMAANPRDALRSMPASSFLRIEVVTTPPAKYDSEGLTGIINIITNKRVDQGYNISIGSLYNSRLTKGFFGSMAVKTGRLGIYGSFDQQYRNFSGTAIDNQRTIFNPDLYRIEQTGTNNKNSHSGSFGIKSIELSYDIDSLNLLTGSVAFNTIKGNQNGSQLFSISDQFGNLAQSYLLNNNLFSQNVLNDIGINYQRGFKNNKERLLTFSYTSASSDNSQAYNNVTIDGFNYANNDLQQQNKYGSKEKTFQLDYVQPIKRFSIETGAKFIARNYYSDFESKYIYQATGQLGNTSTDQLDYRQTIYSFYNSYQYKLKSWGIKTGFRLERTVNNANFTTQAAELQQAYNDFAHTVVIWHKFKNTSGISLGYNQRILRPGIGQLNPFINKSDPLFYTSGNPNLLPVFAHSFALSYSNFNKGSVLVSLNYSFSNNTIQSVTVLGADSVNHSTFENTGKSDNLGLYFNVNYPVTEKLSTNFNGSIAYLWASGLFNTIMYKNEGAQAYVNSLWTYRLTNSWRISYNVTASTSGITLQGRSASYFSTATRLYKDFFDKKFTAQLSVYNPLRPYAHRINQLNSPDFIQTSDTRVYIRGIFLKLTYRFGKLKELIKKAKKSVADDDDNIENPKENNQQSDIYY